MNEEIIISLVREIVAQANKKFNLNMPIPSIEFFIKGHVAGWAHCQQHKVEYNITIAKAYPDRFHNTVIHEVAHLVVYTIYGDKVAAHGKEFKSIDLMLGGLGTTYHSYDIIHTIPTRTLTRYICKCTCGEGKYTKKVSLGGYRCKICKTSLVFTGEVIKIKP